MSNLYQLYRSQEVKPDPDQLARELALEAGIPPPTRPLEAPVSSIGSGDIEQSTISDLTPEHGLQQKPPPDLLPPPRVPSRHLGIDEDTISTMSHVSPPPQQNQKQQSSYEPRKDSQRGFNTDDTSLRQERGEVEVALRQDSQTTNNDTSARGPFSFVSMQYSALTSVPGASNQSSGLWRPGSSGRTTLPTEEETQSTPTLVARAEPISTRNQTTQPEPQEVPSIRQPQNLPHGPDDAGIIATDEPSKQDDTEDNDPRLRKVLYVLICILVVVFVGGVTTVVILVLRRNNDGTTPSSAPQIAASTSMPTAQQQPVTPAPVRITTSPSMSPSTREPTSVPSGTPVENSPLFFLRSIAFDGGQAILTPGTPQYRAMQWLEDDPDIDTYEEYDLIQRYGLATLFYSTRGERWTESIGWLGRGPTCSWYPQRDPDLAPTSVCNDDGHLEVLSLRDNNLLGSLPVELGHLTNLLAIDLKRNSLTGTIPPLLLGRLSSLLLLDIFNNRIVGSIPTEIGLISGLFYQDFDSNQLTGTIPTTYGKLWQLETLWLNNNGLRGTIPTQFGLMTNLTNAYFAGNSLDGSVPDSLCALGLLNLETDCEVSCSCCTNRGMCSTLPDAPASPSSSPSQSEEENLIAFLGPISPDGGAALNNQSSPQYRAVSWLAADAGLSGYSNPTIIQRYTLATLYFSTGGPNWDLASGWLTDANECNWFNNTVPSCNSTGALLVLDLTNNLLSGTIPEELVLLSDTLTDINFGENAGLVGTLPSVMGLLTQLQLLDLSRTGLMGPIPSQIGQMVSLTRLRCFRDSFQGTLPSEIGLMTNLEVLDFGLNQLVGTIPSEIGNLVNLKGLSLYRNNLTGTIPPEFGRLSRLEMLFLDALDLTGTVPPAICNFRGLMEFYSDCDEIGCTCCTMCCSGADDLSCTEQR